MILAYRHDVYPVDPNHSVIPNRVVQDLVVHWWGNPNKYRSPSAHEGVVRWFTDDPQQISSAHAVISGWPEPRVSEIIPVELVAWHAGNWPENMISVGYELQPFDEFTGALQFESIFETAAAYFALLWHRLPQLKDKPFRWHSEFKNTACPQNWIPWLPELFRRTQQLYPFVDVENPGYLLPGVPDLAKEMFMQNPFVGRVTSEYGPRGTGFHAGIDIAPPVPGVVGGPVYAAYAGTVIEVVHTQKLGAKTSPLAPGRTGNGVIVRNPDGERQVYNHMKPAVKVGARIGKGQLLGHLDRSGNQSGPHLHFETWDARGNPRNPRVDFGVAKLKPGVGAPVAAMGRKFLPLVTDGLWGHRTITEMERALKRAGFYKGIIEEDSGKQAVAGPMFWKAYQEFLTANRANVGPADGDFGERSRKAEQEWLNRIGLYPYKPFDGVRGPSTIGAVQRALNAGKFVVTKPTEPTRPTEPTKPTEPDEPEEPEAPENPDLHELAALVTPLVAKNLAAQLGKLK